MKMKKTIGAFLIVLVLLGFIYINLNKMWHNDKVIKVGSILPLSGNIAFLGNAAKNGMEFAKYYFERQDEVKYKIDLIFEDGQGKPNISINAFHKLIDIDQTEIVFSTVSAVDLSLIPIQSKRRLLFFSHASHPKLSNVNRFFYRHSTTVEQEVDFIFNRIDDKEKLSICYMNDEYGVAFVRAFADISGMLLKNSFSFKKGETDFTTISLKVTSMEPNIVIVCGAGSNLSNLPKKLREIGFTGEIITTLAYSASGASKSSKDIGNLRMVELKEIKPDKKFAKYVKEYEHLKNKKLGTFDYIFFNTTYILINAINSVGLDIEEISHEISRNKYQNVLGGIVSITPDNNILPELTFKKI